MSLFREKIREVLLSVLPITVIVILLHLTLTPLPGRLFVRFLLGAALIVAGLSVLLFGIEIGISPLGQHVGSSLSKKNKLWLIAAVGLVMGFFISVAEPDLQILANQVASVTDGQISSAAILLVVSAGIAALLVAGLYRIVFNLPLNRLLLGLYGVIFLLSCFLSPEMLAISFDASGATTGALTVPFILALALGVSGLKKDGRSSEEDSFGLVAVTSTGAIFGVLLMGLIRRIGGLSGSLPAEVAHESSLLAPFFDLFPQILMESLVALAPVVLLFLGFQKFLFQFKKKPFRKILKGMAYTLIGLTLFLTGVNAGFMQVGRTIGAEIAVNRHPALAVGIGFVFGLVTILAEPAVHVLTDQVETVTNGYIRRNLVLATLSLGVGMAVALSILRIEMESIQLWHYLLPGYILSAVLSFCVPNLFVGIAYDSGGVASGPMTATFILAFAQGVAEALPGADVLRDGFGLIALVAMTPIVTLQLLGLALKIKMRRKKVDRRA